MLSHHHVIAISNVAVWMSMVAHDGQESSHILAVLVEKGVQTWCEETAVACLVLELIICDGFVAAGHPAARQRTMKTLLPHQICICIASLHSIHTLLVLS